MQVDARFSRMPCKSTLNLAHLVTLSIAAVMQCHQGLNTHSRPAFGMEQPCSA